MIGVQRKAAKERERIKSDDDTDYASYRLQVNVVTLLCVLLYNILIL